MRRDVIANVILFFTLLSLLLVFQYPVYFAYGQVIYRDVSIPERIFSVAFILLWMTLCLYSAYFKRIYLLIGGILYGLIPYIPGYVIPILSKSQTPGNQDLISMLLISFMKRLYELVNAPFVGVSVLFPPGKAVGLSKTLLPVLLISYIGTQLFRFYRNAYLAEKLRLDDTSYTNQSALPKASPATGDEPGQKRSESVRPAPVLPTPPSAEPERLEEGGITSRPAGQDSAEPILLYPPKEAEEILPSEPIRLFASTGTDEHADANQVSGDPDRTMIRQPLKPARRKKSGVTEGEENRGGTDL